MVKKHLKILDDGQDNKSLWAIGWMCFFWSVSSLILFSVLPLFLRDVLHFSNMEVGLLEGVAIALSFGAKIFSGFLSDHQRQRKPIIFIGTAATAVAKASFALVYSWFGAFMARSFDRVVKGVRSAPTSALIADLSPNHKSGTSFGVRQCLYTLGAALGGLFGTMLLIYFPGEYRLIFLISAVPAVISLIILKFFIIEPKVHADQPKWHLREVLQMPRKFWRLMGVVFFLMMARFSVIFLSLRAREVGWSDEMLPMVIVFYEIIHALIAVPVGKLADKKNRYALLFWGILTLILTNTIMMLGVTKIHIFMGILCAGLHMGMTQGLLSTLVAESTLSHLRGTAFALFFCVTGIAVLLGNGIAGYLADLYGVKGAFMGGFAATFIASILLACIILSNKHKKTKKREKQSH